MSFQKQKIKPIFRIWEASKKSLTLLLYKNGTRVD